MTEVSCREPSVADMRILLIEYNVEGWDVAAITNKRYALEERMQALLPQLNLGFCESSSTGNGTIEVCCFVIDYDLAKSAIEHDLAGTEFADYSRIYDA